MINQNAPKSRSPLLSEHPFWIAVSLRPGLRCAARLFFVAVLTAVVVMTPYHVAEAGNGNGKGPKMPAPTAVFKDADGKTIGQLVGFWTMGGAYVNPLVLLNFDGVLGLFEVGPKNIRSLGAGGPSFSGSDCTGQVYLGRYLPGGFADMTEGLATIVGPDSETGTYRVFVARTETPVSGEIRSSMNWRTGTCTNSEEPTTGDFIPAEELLPNPLADFHGPTAEHPERTLTIEGGTRY